MQRNNKLNRRNFMKFLLGSSALGAAGQLGFMTQAQAATPAFSDYKALVCIFMKGGNDSFNMLIPMGADPANSYDTYAGIRGNLAVSQNPLNAAMLASGTLGNGSNNPYYAGGSLEDAYRAGIYDLSDQSIGLGVNGVMPELAQLISTNQASVMANIGTLVRPVSRAEIQAKTADLPVFLFAHNHQQRILQTGQADNLGDIGWAGKIADYWQGVNGSSPFGMNISYAGNNRMLIGKESSPLVLNAGKPPRLSEMVNGGSHADKDRIALFKALQGRENTSATGNLSFESSKAFNSDDPLQRLYGDMLDKSYSTFEELYQVWNENDVGYQSTGPYGESLFANPGNADLGLVTNTSGRLIAQLESVAKMIHLSASGAFGNIPFKRQVFMVDLGGFDTHSAQLSKHPLLLRELSMGLWKFQKAMDELGHANKVTTFSMSDFGRSMSNNGDGTDHAWGGHHIVMGGDGQSAPGNLQGGQMLGSLPDIRLGGNDDHKEKGRIIPSTSQDQLNATLCRWFGVDESMLAGVFPNLANFADTGNSPYLDDLFA